MKTHVTLSIELPFSVKKDAALYISACPALDVYSQGPSRSVAVESLIDALRTFLLSCYEMGTLNQAFRESGFKPAVAARRFSAKKPASKGFNTLQVPLRFLVETRRTELI